jgi:hypothetical protein
VKLAALAAGAALLAGCGVVHPGAAAVVGSDTIPDHRVDDVAVAVCSANLASARASNAALPTLPTRGAQSRPAVRGDDGAVRPPEDSRAEPPLPIGDQARGFPFREPGDVEDVLPALPAEANPVIARHRLPGPRARR